MFSQIILTDLALRVPRFLICCASSRIDIPKSNRFIILNIFLEERIRGNDDIVFVQYFP